MFKTVILPVLNALFPTKHPISPSVSVLNTIGTVRKNANPDVIECA